MSRKKKHPEHVNHERWLISYADFITLLFAFFVVMFAVSQVDTKKVGRFTQAFSEASGIDMPAGGKGVFPADELAPAVAPANDKKGNETYELPPVLAGLKKSLSDPKQGAKLDGLQVLERRNELILRLSENVIFDSGDDQLKQPARAVLLVLAEEVKARKIDIRVEGHTDNRPIHTGCFRSNWELSTARATAVISLLAGDGGIDPARLSAAGYGQFHPVAENLTLEGRAKNRRVDLIATEAKVVEEATASVSPEAKSEEKTDPKADGKTEEKPSIKPENKGETKPAGESKPKSEAAANEKPKSKSESEPESETKTALAKESTSP